MAFVGLGCDQDRPALDDASRGLNRPPMRIIRAEAVTGYDQDGRPIYAELSEGALTPEVARSGSLRLTFDRFLLPVRVIRQSICVRPSLTSVADLGACQEPFQTFTEPAYDPARRQVVFRLSEGRRHLPGTAYRLTVFDPDEDVDETGFRAFDGATLDRAYVFDFTTQAEGGDERDELEPGRDAYCAAVDCFRGCDGDPACAAGCRPLCVDDACFGDGDLIAPRAPGGFPALFESCNLPGCHRPGRDFVETTMGLDLSSLSGLEGAIGRVAHQTQTGAGADEPTVNPDPFGRRMPLIDPGNPGNSYLLYKLILSPENHVEPPPEAEVRRLRAAAVPGLPMPASITGPGGGMVAGDVEASQLQLDRLSAWIANGAVIRCP